MVDIAEYARRIRRRMWAAGILFFGGALMMVLDFTTKLPTTEKGEFAAVWANHLPLYRRAGLRTLSATVRKWVVPYLESHRL